MEANNLLYRYFIGFLVVSIVYYLYCQCFRPRSNWRESFTEAEAEGEAEAEVVATEAELVKKIKKDKLTKIVGKPHEAELGGLPYLWTYWENLPGEQTPGYIDLCFDTMIKHCGRSFSIKFLNERNIREYIPEMRLDIDELFGKEIFKKVDYYRLKLLHRFGGLWLDADTIVLTDLKPIMDKLKSQKLDMIGFGCTGMVCKGGFRIPSNGVIAAKPGSKVIKHALDQADRKITEGDLEGFYSLGKKLLWDALQANKFKHYDHYDVRHDGSRDKNGLWITPWRQINDPEIELLDESKLMFTYLYNSKYGDDFKKMTKAELMKMDNFIGKMFRKSLLEETSMSTNGMEGDMGLVGLEKTVGQDLVENFRGFYR